AGRHRRFGEARRRAEARSEARGSAGGTGEARRGAGEGQAGEGREAEDRRHEGEAARQGRDTAGAAAGEAARTQEARNQGPDDVGSKLPVLAAIQVMLLATAASADQAGDLFKAGIDHYKAGKYTEAVTELSKSYKLDPKPEALFALAQAERLAGN